MVRSNQIEWNVHPPGSLRRNWFCCGKEKALSRQSFFILCG